MSCILEGHQCPVAEVVEAVAVAEVEGDEVVVASSQQIQSSEESDREATTPATFEYRYRSLRCSPQTLQKFLTI